MMQWMRTKKIGKADKVVFSLSEVYKVDRILRRIIPNLISNDRSAAVNKTPAGVSTL